jgi:hypothetical protein
MLATPADGKSLAAIERAMNRAIPTVELDQVRILKPEEVEGVLPAAEETFAEGADAQAADSGPQQNADQADQDGGKSKSGKRRRRGGRSKSKKQTETEQPQSADAPSAKAGEQLEAAPESVAAAANDDTRTGDSLAADKTDQPADARQVRDDQTGGKSKGRSRSKRGGKKAKQADKPAAANGDQPQAGAPGDAEPQSQPAAARTPHDGKSGGQKAGKDKRGERIDQASNGKQSKPFGDHTPAFLLKPVPQRATA